MNALTRSTEPGVVLIVDDTPDNLRWVIRLRHDEAPVWERVCSRMR
jgi:mevalonate pyrophosphate decarboxylase